MEDYKNKYENLLHDIDIAIAGQKEGETKIVLQNLKERHTESEDERIRKELLNAFQESEDSLYMVLTSQKRKSFIAWLEKQGQKSADKVEPKFHEGDIIIHKELGGDYIHNSHKIIQVDILDKKYRLEGGLVAHFSEQDDYELVEQKPAWSEEDERMLTLCASGVQTRYNDGLFTCNEYKQASLWLKSLKERMKGE